MKKYKNGVIVVGLAALAIGFFVWGAVSGGTVRTWADTNVQCLPNGHANLAVHIHPTLTLLVDGQEEMIPGNIGVNQGCMAEVHTHDTTGQLHVETVLASRLSELTLADFFTVWGQGLERDGYVLTARVDGEIVDDPAGISFEDRQQIELAYSSVEEGTATSTDEQTVAAPLKVDGIEEDSGSNGAEL
ncbi:MAG: hypothetical protein WD049_08185 [Candidatus Paceibacterota bacterium]